MTYREHSLFPRDNGQLAKAAFQGVLKLLEKERETRQQTYRYDLSEKAKRVNEINDAIYELKVLYRLAVENQK
ncbi:hypothetical protein JCM14036_03190 [Desulfotomaculum defluvii]